MSFEDPDNALAHPGTHPSVELLSHKMQGIRDDVMEIKGAMLKVSDALTKLVVIEERQAVLAASNERAFTEIAKIQRRMDDDADKHATRMETAFNKVAASVERLHGRIDDHAREIQADLDSLNTRVGAVEVTVPETNRLKDLAFDAIKYLCAGGAVYFVMEAVGRFK